MDDRRIDDVVGLLSGRCSAEELAARHKVTLEEVAFWRQTYLAGLEHASYARRRVRRRWPVVVGLLSVGILASTVAVANTNSACNETLPGSLMPFCPDQPAVASEINQNYRALIALIEAKIGALTSSDLNVPGAATVTGAFTTSRATLSGVNALTLPSASIVNDNNTQTLTIIGRGTSPDRAVRIQDDATVTGDLSVGGKLAVTGDVTLTGKLTGGNLQGTVAGGGQLACNLTSSGTGFVVGCNSWSGASCPTGGATCSSSSRITCPSGSTVRDIARDCSSNVTLYPCITTSLCIRD